MRFIYIDFCGAVNSVEADSMLDAVQQLDKRNEEIISITRAPRKDYDFKGESE